MATADQAWRGGSNVVTPTQTTTTSNTTSYPAYNQGVANTTTTTSTSHPAYNQGVANTTTPTTTTTTTTPTTTTSTAPKTTTTTTQYGERTGGSTTTTSSNTTTSSTTTDRTEGGSTSRTDATGQVSGNTQANYNKYTGAYQESQTVRDAYNKLQQSINQKPGEFNSSYTDQLNTLYDQIMQRDPFSYSLKDDALFDIYRQRYEAAGENAMKDTQGQYAANTGGYANSAGETAGFQAYQGYLNELQNTIPELYSMAYNRYKDQVDIDFNKYDITKGREDTDYQQYRDKVGDWQSDRDFLQGQYSDERNFDYKQWNDYRNFWQNELWKEKESQWTTTESNWSNTVSNTVTTTTTTQKTDSRTWEDPYKVTTTTTTK